ncbi:hypothetical protein OZY43_00480 [Lactobacillus sp. ESL0785]|uniref:hypothetical protein n=1 Tax=Lactobacillus sp. ESL0785 TaxID=2983232 RepID=UPI0023F6AEF5|nr:hypothetical protein [Lactobacillus sp. ESL0785]WEV70951.1 hypothetical protein OZY43_00480 [Lactobacillus sp. ESL0785]
MRFKKIIIALSTAFLMIVLAKTPTTVHAKYVGLYATPTELRGNWYQYVDNGYGTYKLNHWHIFKHAIKLNGKTLISSQKHGTKKLYVTLWHEKGGIVYSFNKANYHYQDLGEFWLSKRKIHGRRVMKSYYNMGYFEVYTRAKLRHNYCYEVKGSTYLKKLGQ